MDKFVIRIIEHRKAKGLTQKQMADKLGLTQVGYSKIETGKTELTLDRALRIAKILESDLLHLLYPTTDTDIEIINENEVLTTRLVEKDLLINSIINENKRLKFLLLAEIYGNFESTKARIQYQITKSKDEFDKESLKFNLGLVERNLKRNCENFINTGIFEQSDIEEYKKSQQEAYDWAMNINKDYEDTDQQ